MTEKLPPRHEKETSGRFRRMRKLGRRVAARYNSAPGYDASPDGGDWPVANTEFTDKELRAAIDGLDDYVVPYELPRRE